MKEIVKLTLFILINLFFSCWLLQFTVLLAICFLIAFILPKGHNDEDIIYVFIIMPILLFPLFWKLKTNFLSSFYNSNNDGRIYKFLNKFLCEYKYRKKVFLVTLIIDIINVFVSYFIPFCDYHGIRGYFIFFIILTILLGGNLTSTYGLFCLKSRKLKLQ